MDEHTYRVLEFNKILSMAASYAVTFPGNAAVNNTRPVGSIDGIRHKVDLVSECRRMMSEGRYLGIEHFKDLSPLFSKLKPSDAVIRPFELRSFLPLFFSANNLKILSEDPECPGIGKIVSELITHPDLIDAINKSIDREGKIRDKASPELMHIRQSIKSHEKKIRGVLEDTLRKKEMEHFLQDIFVAERNNRWVVPVKRDLKAGLPGIVHDISNTGETVYVEPYSIQHIGNELESYHAEEKLEEYKILKRLSGQIREHLYEIRVDYRIVIEVDVIQAIAGFSESMKMSSPEMNKNGRMKIVDGRHPLLWKTLKKKETVEELVPLDIEMGRGHSCMVITGSNAGGKTVALKTIGVINLMALSGMHVPAGSGTTLPFTETVFADIGDEQSIEQDLSTFSGHIKRVSDILGKISEHALIIIDELGTGTDPEQGGALSSAVLKKMNQLGAIVVVSTHLGMLKAFAHSEQGFVNAAMEMKEVGTDGGSTYRPTYKLAMGEAGMSYAFEIAESLGLDKDIIMEARGFMTGKGGRVEELIADLKDKNIEADKKFKETERLKEEIEGMRVSVRNELSGIKSSRQEKMSEAFKEAEEVMRKARVEAGDIIKAIRKSSLKEAKDALKDLDKKQAEMKKMRDSVTQKTVSGLTEVREGQDVFIHKMGIYGVVQSVNKKTHRCKVEVNGKEIMIPFSDLSDAVVDKDVESDKKNKERLRQSPADRLVDVIVPSEIKVIGQRVDPALSDIERYLNEASMAELNQVKIIHGIGAGILSKMIGEFLEDHPLVDSYRKGEEDEGGEGVTVVFL